MLASLELVILLSLTLIPRYLFTQKLLLLIIFQFKSNVEVSTVHLWQMVAIYTHGVQDSMVQQVLVTR